MSRKDYIRFADMLRSVRQHRWAQEPAIKEGFRVALNLVETELVDILAKDSPRFNANMFRSASKP